MDAQYAAAYPELYRTHWWWRAREAILIRTIRRLFTPPVRILDVGCGAGLFFEALQPFGDVEGIESDASAAAGGGRWRDRIVVGRLDRSYVPRQPFDLVLVLDVLEHVADPEPMLRRAGECLSPDGRVLVTVPAFRWLWTSHDDLNLHVTRYTASTLRDVIRRAGLVPLETGYLFQSLVVPKLLVRFKEALVGSTPQVPALPPPGVNAALQAWLRVEHALAGWLPFGGSLLAIAARPGGRTAVATQARSPS